jgi:short-chain fatty acids transporter
MVGFAERWFPDAYVFVLIAVILVAAGTILHGGSPLAVSRAFGDGFWNLIPFTMQMALVAIGGYVVAMSPPIAAVLRRLAGVPSTARGAVVFVGVLSIVLSLLNWGLSLIFSGLLVREIARRKDIKLDYRAAGAAGYLGLAAASRSASPRPPHSFRPMRRAFRVRCCRSPASSVSPRRS